MKWPFCHQLTWHQWEPWSDPQPVMIQKRDEYGNKLGESYFAYFRQQRSCTVCHQIEIRRIDP